MDMHGSVDLQPEVRGRRPSSEECTSERLIPSRGTCGVVGQLRLGRDENWAPKNEYHEVLSRSVLGAEGLGGRLLRYGSEPRQGPHELRVPCTPASLPAKARRVLPQSAAKVLDAPGLVDDFYSHPVDWSARNVVAVALSEMVFLFDVPSGRTERLLTLPAGNATALRWTGEGQHLAVGTSSGEVQLWDQAAQRQLRSLRGHGGRIGALAWHGHVLSSGSADAEVHHHDVRVREHLVGRALAHADFVCGLDYSADGALASGGNDNRVMIWELQGKDPLHILTQHRAAVKALRWCPWQRRVLASGGGTADRQVCLWNGSSGKLLAVADAESQVTGVLWAPQDRELLTAHGYSRNQLSLWRYPSLCKAAELEGHSGRLLGLAQSPDGSLVCSSSADETLRFWRVFSPLPEKRGERGTPSSILRTIR